MAAAYGSLLLLYNSILLTKSKGYVMSSALSWHHDLSCIHIAATWLPCVFSINIVMLYKLSVLVLMLIFSYFTFHTCETFLRFLASHSLTVFKIKMQYQSPSFVFLSPVLLLTFLLSSVFSFLFALNPLCLSDIVSLLQVK